MKAASRDRRPGRLLQQRRNPVRHQIHRRAGHEERQPEEERALQESAAEHRVPRHAAAEHVTGLSRDARRFLRQQYLVIAEDTNPAEVFTTVARERVTNMAAVVPLITNVVERQHCGTPRRSSSVARRAERRGPAGSGTARPPSERAPVHSAGNLRHPAARSHQHDPGRPTAMPCCWRAPGAPVSEWDEIAVLNDAGNAVARR